MIPRLLLAALLLIVIAAAGLFGGGGFAVDQTLVHGLAEWRASHGQATQLLILLTSLGGAPVLLTLAAVAALVTARRDRHSAIALVVTILGGRLLIELAKLAVDRPRPAFDAHPVQVFSQSFPSGHAGNTMMTFGAIALWALPERWRSPGFVAAVLLSVAIGATRPVLGVHWPSDVLAGWCLGGVWLLACWSLWLRLRPTA